jgi:ABC-2 type transport system ATP-binding protein
VVRRFGDVTALDGVSFEVSQGEIFGLIGPNGAGKTTLLNCVEGLDRPTSYATLSAGAARPVRRAALQ